MCPDVSSSNVLCERAIYQFLPVECSCFLASKEYLEFSRRPRPWGAAMSEVTGYRTDDLSSIPGKIRIGTPLLASACKLHLQLA